MMRPNYVWQTSESRIYGKMQQMFLKSIQIGRPLLNTKAILSWVHQLKMGGSAVDKFHVTLAYSTTMVDWENEAFQARTDSIVVDGGGRSLQLFDRGALVLVFYSKTFAIRWQNLTESGAKWDYPEFLPHITLARNCTIIPSCQSVYDGPLIFGPEYRKPTKS